MLYSAYESAVTNCFNPDHINRCLHALRLLLLRYLFKVSNLVIRVSKIRFFLSEQFSENGRIPGCSNEEKLVDIILIHIQDVFRDFCDKTGQIPKDKVADAVRCLGENPLQSEVTQ